MQPAEEEWLLAGSEDDLAIKYGMDVAECVEDETTSRQARFSATGYRKRASTVRWFEREIAPSWKSKAGFTIRPPKAPT